MDKRIQQIIDSLGVNVVYNSELEKTAYYIPSIDTILVNSSKPTKEQQKSLLHELGHVCKQKNDYVLYNQTFALHSKMENEAEEYMIQKMIEVRFTDPDFELSTFNVCNFLDSYEIDYSYENVVKSFMTNYLSAITI
ncbi:ImmA/IrrE family metallo-endopeptidase [Enterococcus sp. LJL99]